MNTSFTLPSEIEQFIMKQTLKWEGGYATPKFDGLYTLFGVQNETLVKYYPDRFPDNDAAIDYIKRMAAIVNNPTGPLSSYDEAGVRKANPNVTKAELEEFKEFLQLKNDIIVKDHVINEDLHHVHPLMLGPVIDTSFHRGPEVAWWMMGKILEDNGKGNYDNTIPYHHDHDNTFWHNIPTATKEEILTKFNALVEEKGQTAVTEMMRDAKILQHKHDIAENLAGNNVQSKSINRQKHLEGWTNRANDLVRNNNFSVSTPFTVSAIDLDGNAQNEQQGTASVAMNRTAPPIVPPVNAATTTTTQNNVSANNEISQNTRNTQTPEWLGFLQHIPLIGPLLASLIGMLSGNSMPQLGMNNNAPSNSTNTTQVQPTNFVNSGITTPPLTQLVSQTNSNLSSDVTVSQMADGSQPTLPTGLPATVGKTNSHQVT